MDDGGARERTDVAMEAARKINNIRRAPRATPGPAPPGHRVDCTPACACPWLRVVQYDGRDSSTRVFSLVDLEQNIFAKGRAACYIECQSACARFVVSSRARYVVERTRHLAAPPSAASRNVLCDPILRARDAFHPRSRARARALALPSRSKFSRMNFAPPRAFARVVVALLALLLPTPARAENCGDPLSSCYVGNARAEDQERDSRQKFGQRSEYRPTPIRGQRRLDRFEPVDVIRRVLPPHAGPRTTPFARVLLTLVPVRPRSRACSSRRSPYDPVRARGERRSLNAAPRGRTLPARVSLRPSLGRSVRPRCLATPLTRPRTPPRRVFIARDDPQTQSGREASERDPARAILEVVRVSR